MNGFLLTFYTSESARHDGKRVLDLLTELAKELGIEGATINRGVEGFGASGRYHAARFFELADDPMEIAFAVTDVEAADLLAKIKEQGIRAFYVKIAAEFANL